MGTTILLFLLIIFFLVLVHEWGHFWFARRFGITVEEFAIGFPPRLLRWRPRGSATTFSLNLLPFGGFVRLKGEDSEAKGAGDPDSFAQAPRYAQAAVLVGGVAMNVLAGWLLYTLAYGWTGVLVSRDDVPSTATVLARKLVVLDVLPESPAAEAGVQTGDIIVSITPRGGDPIPNPTLADLVTAAQEAASLQIVLERAGERHSVSITPLEGLSPEEGKRAIGVRAIDAALIRVPWWVAPWEGLVHTLTTLQQILVGILSLLAQLVNGGPTLSALTGPVGIAALVGEASAMGLTFLIPFVALISLNLGVLNLLPLPALDGGRLLIVGIEALLRRPLSPRVIHTVTIVGFAFLLLIVLAVTYQDVRRLIA